ncbi:SWIM zinc finger domain-containing protein [Vibrio breoganii]
MLLVERIKLAIEDKTYKRGVALANKGKVVNVQTKGSTVMGEVLGTHRYSVALDGGAHLYGTCTCPAADFQSICKHMVALAIVHEQGSSKNLPSLESWLNKRSKAELLQSLVEVIEQDETLRNIWHKKMELSLNPPSEKELKKLITKALPKRNIWDYRKVANYFQNATEQLQAPLDVAKSLESEVRLEFFGALMNRLGLVLYQVDDSYGYRLELEHSVREGFRQSYCGITWDNHQKAKWLVNELTKSSEMYAEVLQEAVESDTQVRDLFLSLCLSKLESNVKLNDESRRLLIRILIDGATSWQEEVKYKALIAKDCSDYLHLAEICLKHNEELDAEDWLLRAKHKISDDFNQQCWNEMELQVLHALGDVKHAWQKAMANFVSKPTSEGWQRLLNSSELLHVDLSDKKNEIEQSLLRCLDLAANSASESEIKQVLILFYLHFSKPEKAKHYIGQNSETPAAQKLGLALLIDETDYALSLLDKSITKDIQRGTKTNYHWADKKLDNIYQQIKSNARALEVFTEYKANLEQLHKRKITFIRLLQARDDYYVPNK